MATATPMEATTTERGLLMPSPRPRLMLTPTCCTEDTTDTSATDTATATPTGTDTMARGPLMPTPLLSPLFVGYPYALPYAAPAVVPATQSITYKTYTPTVETNVVATN